LPCLGRIISICSRIGMTGASRRSKTVGIVGSFCQSDLGLSNRCRSCQEAKIAFDKRELDQPKIVERQLLVARRDCTTLFQPPDTLFNRTAVAVADSIIAHRTPAFALASAPPWRNDWLYCVQPQPMADALGVIAPISREPAWTAADTPAGAWDSDLLHH